jgi:hypothetical protein
MDRWGWEQLAPWLELRSTLPVGALFCILRGPTRGRPWAPAGVRMQLHDTAARAGVRRRFAPHQLRHAHAVEMSREGVPLLVIQRQLGHADLAITWRHELGERFAEHLLEQTLAPWRPRLGVVNEARQLTLAGTDVVCGELDDLLRRLKDESERRPIDVHRRPFAQRSKEARVDELLLQFAANYFGVKDLEPRPNAAVNDETIGLPALVFPAVFDDNASRAAEVIEQIELDDTLEHLRAEEERVLQRRRGEDLVEDDHAP